MDDILLNGDDLPEIAAIKSFLIAEFRVKNLGDINYFLGLEIIRENQGFIISQRKFALDLLKEFDTSNVSSVTSPFDPYIKIHADVDIMLSNLTAYRHLVGKLNYLTHIRPDLAFPVLKLTQFIQRPCHSHFSAALRVLKYLA